ncbi:MAG: DUF2786 domain-containing protein [Propionibacteriales bacterium]|nr:DUF2786 domain-containing protein [Propionibacteriales bacterium]
MGRNSKQRRDAKRRKDAGGGRRGPRGSTFGPAGGVGQSEWSGADALAFADLLVVAEVRRIATSAPKAPDLLERAEFLRRRIAPLPVSLLAEVLRGLLARVVTKVAELGWSPEDLGELVSRQTYEPDLPLLVDLLTEDAVRTRGLSPAWRAQLEGLGARGRVSLDTAGGLASGLGLAALLGALPEVPPTIPRLGSGLAAAGPDGDHKKLATVRALLAKAESTQYDAEAEALSAKAQELISRYALDRLLQADSQPMSGDGDRVAARRIWLDAPYLLAKAALVNEVAMANRCRSVVMERPGFCTVVGDPPDLEAIELLVTSLLAQGTAAMVRHGRHVDSRGVSRTAVLPAVLPVLLRRPDRSAVARSGAARRERQR